MRVGVIGCGQIANVHIPAIRKYSNVEIVGVADINSQVLENTASEFNIKDKFSDPLQLIQLKKPDVVHILTPVQYHHKMSKSALESGCHVYVEKSMCLNATEAEDLVKTANDNKVKICIGHNHVFDAVMIEARKLAEAGSIGSICSIDCGYAPDLGADPGSRYFTQAYRYWAYDLPGGIFQNFLDHPLSVILPFIPNPDVIHSVSSESGVMPPGISSDLQIILKDSKITAHINFSFSASPRFYYLTLFGTKGNLHVDFFNKNIVLRARGNMPRAVSRALINLKEGTKILGNTLSNTAKVLTGKFSSYEGLERLVTEFYKSIEQGTPSPIPSENGISAMRIMDEVWKQIGYPKDNKALINRFRAESLKTSKKKILVTGATGFVGKHLIKKLSENNEYDIRVLARNPRKAETLRGDHPIDILIGDLSDETSIYSAVEDTDVIYHLAATMGGKWTDYEEGTIGGTERLIQAALYHKVKRFVYMSSISVYGIPDNGSKIINEETPYANKHVNNYMKSKIEAERLIMEHVKNNELPATILRAGVIYGPGKANRLPRIGYQVFGKYFVKIGLNNITLPVVYMDNIIKALILAGDAENSIGQIYNIVDDEKFTQIQYLRNLSKYGKTHIHFIRFPYALASGAGFIVNKMSKYNSLASKISSYLSPFHLLSCANQLDYDNSKIKRELGWNPDADVENHFRETFE